MERPGFKHRNVVPRWRALSRTASQELKSTERFAPGLDLADVEKRFVELYKTWRENPTLASASEAIDSAVLLKAPYLAVGPAKAILKNENAMPAIKRLAQHVLEGRVAGNPEVEERKLVRPEIIAKIRGLKSRGIEEPRNGLLWLEKGRLQTLVGDKRGALKSLERALTIAPDNRQILRAMATFSAHTGEPDRALRVLNKSGSLRHDPWLQSAEIALSDFAGSSPTSAKFVIDAVRDDADPVHLSEATAALGTLDLGAGSGRRAKKLFRYSLIKPTENALSQAFWVREALHFQIGIDANMLQINGAFEARVSAALEKQDWDTALENCKKWLSDEPFSRRAVSEGSFIATSFLWMPQEAIAICDAGLVANPDDFMISNNKTVALARFGDARAAERILLELKPSTSEEKIYLAATTGLVEFRKGQVEDGRFSYYLALSLAEEADSADAQFRGVLNWLYEEVAAGCLSQPEAISFVEKLKTAIEKNPDCRKSTGDFAGALLSRLLEAPGAFPLGNASELKEYISGLLKRHSGSAAV